MRDRVAIVWIDNPPVNALSQAVRAGLLSAVEELDGNSEVSAVVLACKGRTFIAGADIREFDKPPMEPHLPDVIARIEAASKPWIAALHGTALGGGFEVALGCHYRVADPRAKVGLPEVHLGLIPGAGGTVRLPRLTPVANAVQMVSGGRPVGATEPLAQGIFDSVAQSSDELLDAALTLARQTAGKPAPAGLSGRDPIEPPDEAGWSKLIEAVRSKARGQLSPVEAALAVRDAAELPVDKAFAGERDRFVKLRATDQSKALRHVFFAERQTAKVPAIDGIEPRAVNKCGVIGGGTMGAGIAACLLLAGLAVTLIERDGETVDFALKRVGGLLDASHKRGLVNDAGLAAMKDALGGSTDYAALADCDLVIEAVFEDMNIKREVFARLDQVTRPDAVLATNTSYLDVNEIASAIADPKRVLGLHFFSPAHVMKLVEVIATDTVSADVLATGFALAKRLRKTPVLARVCDGFIGNRILTAYRKQCDYMLEDGALPADIDSAMRQWGMPMGLFEMADMAGLDIGWAMRKRQAATRDPAERYVRIADKLCEMGRFGQKTGAGWYTYDEGSREPKPDPIVEQIIVEESRERGITREKFSAEQIQARILDAMVSEGKKILDEGIAQRASDIDMVMILGYGFPRWRGGPMFMAERFKG